MRLNEILVQEMISALFYLRESKMNVKKPRKPRTSLSLEVCHQDAEKNGGVCLSKEFVDQNTKMDWRCAKGHEFKMILRLVRSGSWCRKCRLHMYDIDYCREFVKKHNGKCLSSEYKNNNTLMEWECKKGHTWKALFSNILTDHWCKACAFGMYTLEDMRAKAGEYGGECLSVIYPGIDNDAKWRCVKGHEWVARWGHVLYDGTWCPNCTVWKGEQKIQELLDAAKVKWTGQKTFENCKGTGGGFIKFDLFLPDYNILIEFDGAQHFKPVEIFQGIQGFQKRIHHDTLRSNYCEENGITLIRIAFDEDLEVVLAERLERALEEKFVMYVQISPEYENQVEAIFGEERYHTFKLPEKE